MRLRSLSALLYLIFPLLASAQLPTVHSLKNSLETRDLYPFTISATDGGFYIYNRTEGTGDSLFTSVTRLDASLEPVWNRVFKMGKELMPWGLSENADGSLVLLARAFTGSASYPVLVSISSSGDILDTREIEDTASTSGTANLTHRLQLENGSEVIIGGRVIIHVNPQGVVDYSKQPLFRNDPSNALNIKGAATVPGTNFWVALGQVHGTNLCFYSRWEDTTLINLHVYDTSPIGLNTSLNNPHIYPNQDVVYSWQDASERLQIARLTAEGNIVWWKSFKINTCNPARLRVDSNEEIWITGAITPSQLGGLITHFSSEGEYIKHIGQFQFGSGQSNISGFEPMPNGEYFAVQSGYVNPDEVLFLNHFQSNLILSCYDAPVPAITDTSYVIIDSAVVNVGFFERGHIITQQLSSPLTAINSTVIKSVDCTPSDIEKAGMQGRVKLFPNPAIDQLTIDGLKAGTEIRILSADGRLIKNEKYSGNLSLMSLPAGLYLLEVPQTEIRLKFVKAE